jgi:hypothetical protein
VPVPAPILDSTQPDLVSAKEILARLERYAEAQRSAPRPVAPAPSAAAYPSTSLDVLPSKVQRSRFDPATADLFPYDLTASILSCAVTIMACISLGRPIALFVTAVLIVAGEIARRRRWFPSLGVNLVIGAVVGLIFVLTA